jgi:alpha-mannosidase
LLDSVAEFHVPANATSATETNLMEAPQGSALSLTPEKDGSVVRVAVHPYEIITLRVDYPAATHQP